MGGSSPRGKRRGGDNCVTRGEKGQGDRPYTLHYITTTSTKNLFRNSAGRRNYPAGYYICRPGRWMDRQLRHGWEPVFVVPECREYRETERESNMRAQKERLTGTSGMFLSFGREE